MDNQPLIPESEPYAAGAKGVLARIWKYKFHYVVVLPAMLLLFIFKFIPLLMGLYMPFVNYQIFKGLFNSTWVGWRHFNQLFHDPAFLQIISNTLLIKAGFIAGSGLLAFVLALALSTIRSGRWRGMLSTLALIPYFVPSVVISYIVILLCSQNQSPFGENHTLLLTNNLAFRPLLITVEIIKTCGIPLVLALAAIGFKQTALDRLKEQTPDARSTFLVRSVMPAAKAITAFMLLQASTLLTTDFEFIHSLLNPIVFRVGETLDTYQFKVGLMSANYSVSAAVWLFQFLVQLVLTVAAYYLVRRFFLKDLFNRFEPAKQLQGEAGMKRAIGIGVAVIYSCIIVCLLSLLFLYPFFSGKTSKTGLADLYAMSPYMLYLFINVAAVAVHLLLILTLAYPLTVKDLPGRGLYKTFLLIAIVMGSNTIPEYLLVRDLGMVNTIFPHFFYGFFSIVSVFVLKSIFNGKYAELKEKASAEGRGELHSFFFLFIPKVWKPWLGLGILHFITLWNSYSDSLNYLARKDIHPPVLAFRLASQAGPSSSALFGDPVILQYGALISLPSVLLFLVFRKLLTSEVLLSQVRKL